LKKEFKTLRLQIEIEHLIQSKLIETSSQSSPVQYCMYK